MNNKQNKLLGAYLQAERMQREIKQETVAKGMNVSKSYVSKIENGRVAITVITLANYCSTIGSNLKDAIGNIADIL